MQVVHRIYKIYHKQKNRMLAPLVQPGTLIVCLLKEMFRNENG
jgi:hypothetical protein